MSNNSSLGKPSQVETKLHSLLQDHNNAPKASLSSIKTPSEITSGNESSSSSRRSSSSSSSEEAIASLINEKQQDFSYVFQPFIADHRRLLELFNIYFKEKNKDTFEQIRHLFIRHSNLEELGLYQAASNYLIPNNAEEEYDYDDKMEDKNVGGASEAEDSMAATPTSQSSQSITITVPSTTPTPNPFNDAVPAAASVSSQGDKKKTSSLHKTPSTCSFNSISSTATTHASVSSDMQLRVQQLLRELPEEHGKLFNVFEEMRNMPQNDSKFQIFMKRLYQDLKNHIDAEELILFPIMFARIPMPALLQMRQSWEDEHKYERRSSNVGIQQSKAAVGQQQGDAASSSSNIVSCK